MKLRESWVGHELGGWVEVSTDDGDCQPGAEQLIFTNFLSGALAMRAIKGAAGRLPPPLDPRAALRTGLARPIINPQALFVEIRRAGGAAKIEQPIAVALTGVIERDGAAARNGLAEHGPDGLPKPFHLGLS